MLKEGKKDMWKDDYILINLTMPMRDQVCTLCRDMCRQDPTQENTKINAELLNSEFFPLENQSSALNSYIHIYKYIAYKLYVYTIYIHTHTYKWHQLYSEGCINKCMYI